MSYLMIENPVTSTPSIDLLITLGASSSRETDRIGQFGSGFPYSLALLAREGLLSESKICLGKDVYTFILEESKDKTSRDDDFSITKIVMKKQNGGRYPLNISTEFGTLDWRTVGMALRELISNAYDGSDDPRNVKVTATDNSRAKDGTIRIYVPMSYDVSQYYNNLYKYFLMGNHDYNPEQTLLRNNCNHETRFYRRGVLVGEYEKGLFDYNLKNVDLKESRVVDTWEALAIAGQSIINGSVNDVTTYLTAMREHKECYENNLEATQLSMNNWRFEGNKESAMRVWREAYRKVYGDAIPCLSQHSHDCLTRKGHAVAIVDQKLYRILESNGITVDKAILSQDELDGKVIEPATKAVDDCLNTLWRTLSDFDLTNGKSKPDVKVFGSIMTKESQTLGYYTQGVIYIHKDISEANTFMLRQTMLEEIGHHITGSTDNSRDFQDWAFRIATTLLS